MDTGLAARMVNKHCKQLKHILLIEDSVGLANHLKEQIDSSFAYHTDVAHTKQDALDKLRRKRYDLVIADLFLPDSDSEIIGELTIKGQRVIAITGRDNDEKRHEILQLPIVDYVIKYDAKTLDTYLVRTLERLNANRNVIVAICDDSKMIRSHIAQLLEPQNLGYIEFENGSELLEYFKEGGMADLILTDFEMPKLDGMEMTRRLRHTYTSQELPIIALSASDKASLLVQFLKSGASDYLPKPFGNEEFLTRLNLTLDHLYTTRQNKKLYEEVQKAASHDFLTQLYNRAYFFRQIGHVSAEALRENCPYGIMMMDIDHFKKVNDTHGHNAGDKAIQHVASILRELSRESDYCFRWGGEEFMVLIPSATPEELEGFGERIRKVVEGSVVSVKEENLEFAITISIGGASGLEKDAQVLISQADEKLYEAKREGRNCVRIA